VHSALTVPGWRYAADATSTRPAIGHYRLVIFTQVFSNDALCILVAMPLIDPTFSSTSDFPDTGSVAARNDPRGDGRRALIVTTVNHPNRVMLMLAEGCQQTGTRLIIVGDAKSPTDFHIAGADYYALDRQRRWFPDFGAQLPTGHYARKNLGYLVAIQFGAVTILETDDDNMPLSTFWTHTPVAGEVAAVRSGTGWYNVYAHFTDEKIWPRGFALSRIGDPQPLVTERGLWAGHISQGLANGNPDVDAIFRLTARLPVTFTHNEPIMLMPGTWCPFNSQNTRFAEPAFPLLYLPSHCSFRMTDIWRSFVAQRCLWEAEDGVLFHAATVHQERNDHDLLADFSDEVCGYLGNERLVGVLEDCALRKGDMLGNLMVCYEALVKHGFLIKDELALVNTWVDALETCYARPASVDRRG